MIRQFFRRSAMLLLVLGLVLSQETWALAGTTGGISGVVTTAAGAPIAGAAVKVTAASESAATTTDASGHFVFLSLVPDTYAVSIQKEGYEEVSFAGVVVFADQSQTLQFKMEQQLKTIAKTTSKAAGALVKAGTTSDVYSVNSATAAKITGLGGGGGLDNAYSAIASMPGAYVPVGQSGWFQAVYIRGGDFDQVGYEVDGVPVNRSFDNYPSNTASALGQQEVQVYTGAAPSNAEGQGLSGYINQVIKTGTYPGFSSADLGIGGPTFYHKAMVEVGGATPDRRFSYYGAIGGYDQAYRYYDQSNGGGISSTWGTPLDWIAPSNGGILGTGCTSATESNDLCYASSGSLIPSYGPGGFLLGPYNYALGSLIADRDAVFNVHFALPHHNDSGRDDLQLLYQVSHLSTQFYNSTNDLAAYIPADTASGLQGGAIGTPFFYAGAQYSGPLGQPFQPGLTTPYLYPSQPQFGNGGAVPANLEDSSQNNVGILKAQYQKNMGSNAYLRAYGYTVYSDWLLAGPNTTYQTFVGVNPADYELSAHTRGISATLADQINSKNLVQLQGSYSTANAIRDNNTQMLNTATSSRSTLAVAVPVADPLGGICLGPTGATSCSSTQGGTPYRVTTVAACGAACPTLNPGIPNTITPLPAGYEYLAVNDGQWSTYNAVTPKFTSASLTDEFDPSDRLHINVGVRYDRYEFDPQSTNTGPARDFWFNAWNNAMCVASVPGSTPVSLLSTPAGTAAFQSGNTAANGGCSALNTATATYNQALLTNNAIKQTFSVVQPRVSFTYTLNPLNVLRFSYGKYDEAPSTAFEEYNSGQQDLPDLLGPTFYSYGRTNPTYPIRPEVSYNTDFSWEHQVKGSDISWKITPFYRKTQDQIEQFFLNQKTGFVSGLNVGQQTSSGVEFQLQKGDFSKNGFSALLSYTFTNAQIKYSPLATGGSIISPINNGIGQYNAYTSACAAGGADVGKSQNGQPLCGTNTGAGGVSNLASPCFTTAGAADPSCAAGDVANPYYNQPAQGFLDPNGSYWPYSLFPGTQGNGSYASFVAPNVATLVLNYKNGKFAATPAFQFSSGSHYGFPLSTMGFDPSSCTGVLPSAIAGDPRYSNGAVGGAPANAQTCANVVPIPNPDTGKFDNIGSYINPSRLTMSMQLTYDVSPRVTTVVTLANLFDTCFGGSKAPWTNVPGVPQSKVCGYTVGGVGGEIAPVGNVYNPGTAIQPYVAHSYGPQFGSLPFNAYVDFKIKI